MNKFTLPISLLAIIKNFKPTILLIGTLDLQKYLFSLNIVPQRQELVMKIMNLPIYSLPER